jgi:hypothetical protein
MLASAVSSKRVVLSIGDIPHPVLPEITLVNDPIVSSVDNPFGTGIELARAQDEFTWETSVASALYRQPEVRVPFGVAVVFTGDVK